MKKDRLFEHIMALLLVMALTFSVSAGTAEEEDEPFVWSEPGLYLTDGLPEVKEIRNEQEAETYALELWGTAFGGEAPAGERSMSVDLGDMSYHFGILSEDGAGDYSANFLSNGQVQALWYSDGDSRWITDGLFTSPDPKEMDPEVWEKLRAWLTEFAEKMNPGVTAKTEPMYVWQIRAVEDRQYFFVTANAKDEECESGLNATVIILEDGSFRIHEYSLYGEG